MLQHWYSGDKKTLLAAITNEFPKGSPFQRTPINGKTFNIMAIDMGIKNFSFAKLQLDKTLPFNTPPLIKEWTKLDVNQWADVSSDASYEPSKYAELSYRVVDELIFNKDQDVPDVVLIERQRIRSAGGKNVLEWVYRVNMFESMLHATILSKRLSDPRVKDSVVVSASPQRMGLYWAPDNSDRSTNKNSKKVRLRLVEKWLADYSKDSLSNPFILPVHVTIENDDPKKSRSASKWIFETVMKNSRFHSGELDSKIVEKGDDLVDSLLHGLSYVKWEKNRMILNMEMKESIDAVIETSDKMYLSHMKSLEFLDSKNNKKDIPLDETEKPKVKRTDRKSVV